MLRIMRLDPHREVGQTEHLRVGNAEFPPLGFGHVPGQRRMAAAPLAVDHSYLLGPEPAAQHTAEALRERRLVNVELVGIDLALDDGFAEAVTAGDEDHVAESEFGVEREDDAAGSNVRAHHLHHGDRKEDLEVIEPVVDAVGDRAVGENRGKAAPAGLEQVLRPPHIEEAFMLARETRGRQILRRRRTPHGDRDPGPGLPFKLAIRFHDLLAERCRVRRPVDDFAGLGGDGRKPLDLALVETVEKPMQLVGDTGL